VYSVTQDGLAFSVIHTFSGIPDGRNPSAALVGGNNGELYGVTLTNRSPLGVTNWGTVFSLGYDGGGYRMLKAFTAKADGRNPLASLTLASDGSLYGTTSAGGDMNAGVIFGLAQPPVISDISMSASGALLRLQGTSSRSYNVQSTTNILQPNWIFLGPAIWTNGFFEFTDSAAGLSEAKFYRAQER